MSQAFENLADLWADEKISELQKHMTVQQPA